MESLFKIRKVLVQHTPIVHFQSGVKGATLRASEVKPKLDKFLIKFLLKENSIAFNPDESKPDSFQKVFKKSKQFNHFLINATKEEEYALDYKIRIIDNTPTDKKQLKEVVLIPDPNAQHYSIKSDAIQLEITCFILELKKCIEKNLSAFFALHNFGTRQNKGWGCYTISGTKQSNFENYLRESGLPVFKRNPIQTQKPIVGNWEQQIKIDHQRLKSGLNHGSFADLIANKGYEKSKLFQYFSSKSITWEKKKIKQEINALSSYNLFSKTGKKEPEPIVANAEKLFIRALLGLPEFYEFAIDDRGQIDRSKKYKIKIEGDVKRFKSPITFKVYGSSIYIIGEKMPEGIFDKKFKFNIGTRSKGFNGKEKDDPGVLKSFEINTPKKDDFDLKKFLEQYAIILGYTKL